MDNFLIQHIQVCTFIRHLFFLTETGKLTAESRAEVERDQYQNHLDLVKLFGQKFSTVGLHGFRHAIANFDASGLTADELSMWFFEHLNSIIKAAYTGTRGRAKAIAVHYTRVAELVQSKARRDPEKEEIRVKDEVVYERLKQLDKVLVRELVKRHDGADCVKVFTHCVMKGKTYTSDMYRLGAENVWSASDGFKYKNENGEEAHALLRGVVRVVRGKETQYEFAALPLLETEVQPLPLLHWMRRVECAPIETFVHVPISDVLDNIFVFDTPAWKPTRGNFADGEKWVSNCIGKQCVSHAALNANVLK